MINGFVEQPCYLDEFVCLDFINEGVSPIYGLLFQLLLCLNQLVIVKYR